MNKIELLAPAKDFEKAKTAIDYGADAVYLGGKSFSLRTRASNFENEDIKRIVEYAHSRGVKIYVTVNIVFHDEDFDGLKEYLKLLDSYGVDAVIVTSPFVMTLSKSVAPDMEVHVSTQLSSLNSEAISTLKSFGADRVVLGREASMPEIVSICSTSKLPVEVFIHGGMCSNYSGRCVMSNRMTNRDANRGGCAHSCRWKYHVYEGGVLISDPNNPLSMSSKDLRAVEYITDMIYCGVSSLKIEGRMKSEYYIAQVVKTYRKLIDEVYENLSINKDRIEYYNRELFKAENRPSDTGFLSGTADESKSLYGVNGAGVTHDYVGIVKGYDERRGLALIEVKNMFDLGDQLEVFGPAIDNKTFVNRVMFDQEWHLLGEAHKPTETIYVRIPFRVSANDMVRKIHES
ncbi:MAG: U32 family peptidase [Erysipelotrichaceae bacterium]|nr:U32 family peptidase [Erysipelotrichaceae bacterium]